jgi:uncharacterized Ntn-hydrolase superfamily protein
MQRFPFAHTYSIVARDPLSGEMGVAVQSHWFSVGSLVTWAEAGVGVVATQAMVNADYGPLGLDLMRGGLTAQQALTALLTADEGREVRQVAMLDAHGNVATHTGSRCIPGAGHASGPGFSVQANMMANDTIWPAMALGYRDSTGSLSERLLAALEAGQAAGGDIRGQQSAAILVVKAVSSGHAWADRIVDLRVEDHPTPLIELKRLMAVHKAYGLMNQGDEQLGEGKVDAALASYSAAAALMPQIEEMPFWHAVTLTELGRLEEALPIYRQVFSVNPDWKELLRRLPPVDLLKTDPASLARILAL